MKHDYSDEFDLNEIYRKLTSSPSPQMVKASEFFPPRFSFAEFEKQISALAEISNSSDYCKIIQHKQGTVARNI